MPRKVTVTVNLHGTGAVVDQAGQVCRTTTCLFTEAPGHAIRLTAHAGNRTTFAGWGGACSGARTTCTLTPGASAATVSAAFAGKARISSRTALAARSRLGLQRPGAAPSTPPSPSAATGSWSASPPPPASACSAP